MRTKRNNHALMVAGLLLAVLALGIWWAMRISPASAQTSDDEETTSPFTAVASTPDSITADTSWGTVTVTGGGDANTARTVRGNPRRNVGKKVTTTDLEFSDITRTSGYNIVTWTVANEENYDNLTFKVERRKDQLHNPDGGWRVMADGISAKTYSDYDVVYRANYSYRITPSAAGATLSPSNPIRFMGTPRVFAFAEGTGESDAPAVALFIRRDASLAGLTQYATIKRYDHRERNPGTGVTIYEHQELPFEVNQGEDTDDGLVLGDIYTYTVELFYKVTASGPFLPVPGAITPPVAVAGFHEPTRPNAPSVTTADNGDITVSWTITKDNQQAVAYEVQTRKTKPLNVNAYVSLGTTVGNSLTFTPPATEEDVSYEYQVVPLNTKSGGKRSDGVSVRSRYPALTMPGCFNPDRYAFDNPLLTENPVRQQVAFINLMQDITKALDDPNLAYRTFDAMTRDDRLHPCLWPQPDDYVLQRAFYYKHQIDADVCTSDPTKACDVLDLRGSHQAGAVLVVRATGSVETLWDVRPQQWGMYGWRALQFSDGDLPAGKYGIQYRVCVSGFNICSYWHDTGEHFHGVTALNFTAPATEPEPEERDVTTLGFQIFTGLDAIFFF